MTESSPSSNGELAPIGLRPPSNRDQTAADDAPTSSDPEQRASDHDQPTPNPDRHAGDDGVVAGVDASRFRRRLPARKRPSRDRGSALAARNERAEARLQTAIERDQVAELRDRVAEARDALDRLSYLADDVATSREHLLARAEHDRMLASADRAGAADDRAWATVDRAAAAHERAEALRDRAELTYKLNLAAIDELTGARTRSFGLDELSRELERARRTGTALLLAFVDVDGLKQVNDAEGHLAGDALLKRVGEILRASFRPYDVIVRYGGDEFIFGMPNLSVSEARVRFERVAQALANDAPIHSISFGLAEAPPANTLRELIDRADLDLLETRRTRPGREDIVHREWPRLAR